MLAGCANQSGCTARKFIVHQHKSARAKRSCSPRLKNSPRKESRSTVSVVRTDKVSHRSPVSPRFSSDLVAFFEKSRDTPYVISCFAFSHDYRGEYIPMDIPIRHQRQLNVFIDHLRKEHSDLKNIRAFIAPDHSKLFVRAPSAPHEKGAWGMARAIDRFISPYNLPAQHDLQPVGALSP